MKRIIAALLSFTVVFSLASCSKKGTETNVKVEEPLLTESAFSEIGTEEPAEDEETVEIIYDFKGLDSEKAITVLTSDKYHIRFRYDVTGQAMYQDVYYDSSDILVRIEFLQTSYSILYKDGVQYTIIDDIYYRMPSDEPEDIGSSDMFEGFGYIGSGTAELDGKEYKYDEFYQTTTDSTTKFLLDDKNELYALQSSDKTMYIEKYDTDFESEKMICIPEGTKELSADEFNTKFMEKVAGNTAVSETKNEENSEAETDENNEAEEISE